MCTSCGCGGGGAHIHGEGAKPGAAGPDHAHDHHDHHGHQEAERAHAPGLSQARMVEIERNILDKNNRFAQANRAFFAERGVLALNFVSSPGSGKTTLLVRTIEALKDRMKVCVIEGDQQTDHDARRIRAAGAPAVQINTGKGCHLDGHMVGHAVERLEQEAGALAPGGVLFIENVGNLVCPAAFDLGEAHRIVVLSVTEGDDKPLKYPDIFAGAALMVINKTDLAPYVDFDMARAMGFARKVNPGLRALGLSARTGEGFDAWLQWIEAARRLAMIGSPALAAAL